MLSSFPLHRWETMLREVRSLAQGQGREDMWAQVCLPQRWAPEPGPLPKQCQAVKYRALVCKLFLSVTLWKRKTIFFNLPFQQDQSGNAVAEESWGSESSSSSPLPLSAPWGLWAPRAENKNLGGNLKEYGLQSFCSLWWGIQVLALLICWEDYMSIGST